MLKVDTVCMETQAQKMNDIASRLNQISSDLSTVSRNLQWKSGVDYLVRRSLNASKSTVDGMAQKAATLKQLLNQAVTEYTKSENAVKNGSNGSHIAWDVKINPNINHLVGPGGQLKILDDTDGADNADDPSWMEDWAEDYKWLKPLTKWLKETESTDEAGMLDGGLGYLKSLTDLFSGDMGGDEYLDLCDNSIGIWKEYYDYLKKLNDGTDGIFSDLNQLRVEVLGLGGDAFGFLSDLWGANETISNSPNMGNIGRTGEYIGTADKLLDMFKSTVEMVLGKEHNLTSKTGGYSALLIYTAIAKGGVEAVSQAFTSIEKYFADGNWDAGDTSATGIDTSLAGMYGITHALTFGLDDFIFGKVEELTGGSKNDDMSYAEKAAEGYKILAKKTGEAIANWWMSITD